MKSLLSIFLFLQIALFAEVSYSDFSSQQGIWTKGEIELRLSKFLEKGPLLKKMYEVTDEAFVLYDRPAGEEGRAEDFRLEFSKEKKKRRVEKRAGLLGARIAIDPGHFGGEYARIEERFIDMAPMLKRTDPVRFDEGTLAFLTGAYLKLLLEKEGAVVMLTREGIGKGAYPDDFFSWLRKNPRLWQKEGSLKDLFVRQYNPLDLRARAEKINAFGPDVTVILHYNADEPGEGIPSNHFISAENYNLVFVPGAFCTGELKDEESRKAFVRLLVSDAIPESLALGKSILAKCQEKLAVPPIENALKSVSLQLAKGVYARNLALTRLVHGPVVYGETLVQNNIDECLNLSRTDFVIDGIRCSSRLKEVAEAYFEGIAEHFSD